MTGACFFYRWSSFQFYFYSACLLHMYPYIYVIYASIFFFLKKFDTRLTFASPEDPDYVEPDFCHVTFFRQLLQWITVIPLF